MLTKMKLACFDWSGVISDDRKPVHMANCRMLDRRGRIPPTFEDWLRTVGTSVHDFFTLHGIQEDAAELDREYEQTFREVNKDGVLPVMYDGVPEVMERLGRADIPTVIVSKHPPSLIQKELRQFGLDKFFITRIIGNARSKADELRTLTRSILPRHAFLVGDMAGDIRAARDAGVFPVGISSGYHSYEILNAENPKMLVSSMKDLLPHLPGK